MPSGSALSLISLKKILVGFKNTHKNKTTKDVSIERLATALIKVYLSRLLILWQVVVLAGLCYVNKPVE